MNEFFYLTFKINKDLPQEHSIYLPMLRSAPTDRLFSVVVLIALQALLLPTLSVAALQSLSDATPIRVRLMRDIAPRTVIISSSGPATLYSGDPTNPIAELPAQTKLTLTTSNNRVYLNLPNDRGIYARSLIIAQVPAAEMTIEIAEAQTIVTPRNYKGGFKIQVDPSAPSTLHIINEVELEDYVEGVLASEFNYDELEASKALAVSIRTMAYRSLEFEHGPDYAIPDNELWQVYKGTGRVTDTVREAVAQTRGQVLRYNGELIEAVYFASSGGRTANNEDVWNASKIQPYLRGKDDPYDFNSPHHNWESTISRTRLLRVLGDRFKVRADGIKILDRSRDGRVRTMAVLDENGDEKILSGNEFRLIVTENFGRESLKSTFFEVNVQPSMYIFTGRGFGHGVGLNQWGALQLSKKGNLYDEILAYYYNDVEIDDGGVINQMITAGQRAIDGASDYFLGPEEDYSPYIEAASDDDASNIQAIYPDAEPAGSIDNQLFGDDAADEAAEEESRRWSLFRRRSDRDATPSDSTLAARRRFTGKRIGW